jgi:hypothetical protein
LQNPRDAKLVEIEIQKAIDNQAQQEQQNQPPDQMPIELAAIRPGFQTPRERKGEHQADDKEEKGEDQILEMEALPCHVFELQIEPVHQGVGKQFV